MQGGVVKCRGASSEKALTTVLERVVIRMVVVVTAIRDIICSRFLIAHCLKIYAYQIVSSKLHNTNSLLSFYIIVLSSTIDPYYYLST